MSDWSQGSFRTAEGMCHWEHLPTWAVWGQPLWLKPYLKQSASLRACLLSWKPYFVIGMAVSHVDPLFHLPAPLHSADPLWVMLYQLLHPLQLSHGFLIALLPSSLSVPAALILGNPWHCCWLGWPEVLLPVNKTLAADWQNVSV